MKKKLLSLLLAGMMVIGMLPVMASAAGIDSAEDLVTALGGNDYATAEGNTVTLKQNVTIVEGNDIYVPSDVTLVIPTGTTLEVTGEASDSNGALKNLAKSAGNIKISGGILKLPSAATVTSVEGFESTIWFGPEGSNGRMEIAKGGSVTISGLDKLASGGCTWTVVGNVTIPEGARANLNMTDSTGTTKGVKLVISNGATLKVDGTLRGVSGGETPSSIEISEGGTLDATDGKLSLSIKPTVNVKGTLHIGDEGIVTVKDGREEVYSTKDKISMSVDATITVTEKSDSKDTIAGLVSVSGGSGETVALENGQLVPVASDAGNSEGAVAYILSGNKITKYGEVKTLLGSANSGDRVVLKKDLTWEKDTPSIGEGVTLVVPKGITLTASTLQNAGSLMTSNGSIEIQAGGTLTLPNDDKTDAGGDKDKTTDDWVGDDEKARMQLTEGIMTFSFGGGTKPTLTIDGKLTVPAGERAFLHVTLDPDGKTATGIDTTLKTGSALTVNGELVLATGETAKGAALTINQGATAIVNGTMTVGAAASLTTNNALTVNGTLTINGANTAGFSEGTITGKITLGENAEVTVAASRDEAEEIAKNIEPADGYEMEKNDNGDWVVKEKETTPPSGGGSTGGGSTGGGTSSGTTYDNTVAATTNGKVTVTDAKKGETATITTTPDKGYKVGTVTAKDEKGNNVPVSNAGNGKYTFTQPEGKVTVTVTFVWDNPFKDVKSGDWWYNAVQYVHLNGLMAGTGTTTFSPTATLTRAQAVQVLYNLEGQPTVTGKNTFTDVASNHWGIKAITWASENGVVAGVGNNKFDPDVNVSREQFAQMMYNYATYKKYNTSASADLTKFPDDDTVSSWATKALAWANAEGLINGTEEDGTVILAPNGTANRAQAASILMNFDKNVVM